MPDPESDAIDDISDWEAEEGLPQLSDPFLQQWLSGREALIEEEQMKRSDNAFRQSLTPLAVEACAIVSRVLAEERRTTWTERLQHDVAETEGIDMYPGMIFHLARDTMEKTKSWEIIKHMPKGALLHAHADATMNVAFLIKQALATEGMAISSDYPLTDASARARASVLFRFRKSFDHPGPSIWTADYKSNTFVPLREAAAAFPNGGFDGFKTWVTSICTINAEDSLKHYHGVDMIWQKFASCFQPLDALQSYEPILRASIRHLLEDLIQDGIRWVDFRCIFGSSKFFKEGKEDASPHSMDLLQVWSEEIHSFQESEDGKGFWGCRFIWTTLRSWSRKQVLEHMKSCIEMKLEFPDLICGFDCVGYENAGRSLADLTPELFWFKKRCVENGVDIPFFFHAGECIGDGDEADQNLFDAILLGTRRIGHGFSLYRHPLLIDMVKSKRILVECCPISNEILRLTSSIKAHSLPALLSRGVPCCLSNDDPGVLGYESSGVTHDFWQALQGWENLGLEGLGSLAENGVRWACYEDQSSKEWGKDIADGKYGQGIRAIRMRQWTEDWNKFCEWIVENYAIQYGGSDI
ncbi:uncharacterized protein KY384_001543 [Bacidia gigantensis]|uniref:uncharacterized protein n=1 Tax=Bacidia gigantensis TaxID=2732470 RepID=UPI001D05B97B|nr:uncharacterized protein KY384_001543 [Bacidia gigantensis]KAG8533802.1 hypothetical protein KY384_001543 [Bacidia gigantensis]